MTLEKWLEFLKEILEIILWPGIVLLIFLYLRTEIKSFLKKIQEAELPGGIKLKAISEEIKEAEEIKEKILIETDDKKLSKSFIKDNDINNKMISLGLEPSPSGLDIHYYYNFIKQDPNIALAGLRMDLEIMLKNLAIGFKIPIEARMSSNMLSQRLLKSNAITRNQYQLINTIIRICNAAIHGGKVTEQQAIQVLEIAPVLIDDYVSWLSWGFEKSKN